jgi:hypothetical protein
MQSEVANLLDINLKSKPKMQTCCIANKHPKQIKSNQIRKRPIPSEDPSTMRTNNKSKKTKHKCKHMRVNNRPQKQSQDVSVQD